MCSDNVLICKIIRILRTNPLDVGCKAIKAMHCKAIVVVVYKIPHYGHLTILLKTKHTVANGASSRQKEAVK